eukprot:6906577-Prymnesium_polylepis.1
MPAFCARRAMMAERCAALSLPPAIPSSSESSCHRGARSSEQRSTSNHPYSSCHRGARSSEQ